MLFEKLPVPKSVILHKGKKYAGLTKLLGRFPYFVKPVSGGSSVGASIASNINELRKSINLAFIYDDRILIDEFVKGMEVTCAVIGNDDPIALPVIEIKPLKGKFFDYESKYSESGSEEIVPARISKTLTAEIQKMAVKVYKVVGCRGFGRIDFILRNDKHPIILEINTIPGLTSMSLLPKAAKAAGIPYTKLLDKIISYAIEK
jgi:D-alanine-D-alanine ligase